MKARPQTAKRPIVPTSRPGLYTAGLLAVILIALFWRSFLPDYVHFSNDGPLGQQNAAWLQMPGGLTGMWDDLNYLGANSGTYTLGVTTLLHALLSPVAVARFYPVVALLLLGVAAWTFFRQLKLSPLAATLGALAAMLNSTFFSAACWGVASQAIALGMAFFALALIVGCRSNTPWPVRWARLALAGLCVGMNVIEAADIGALLSMLVALFVMFHAWSESEGTLLRKAVRGVTRVVVVAGFAFWIALQAVLALVGTQISGVAGAAQDAATKAAQWDPATQWSLPKAETLGLLVPGLFGYKMDTPNGMMPSLQDAYQNGLYWGGVGRAPELDRYFESGSQGDRPPGYIRFSGGGNYCGLLVLLVAAWAIAQSLRRQNSLFSETHRRLILFWAVVALICLPLAWGRFAPFSETSGDFLFYALLYKLPYFSAIRNPAKFVMFLGWALVIIFACGIHALNRTYLDPAAARPAGLWTQLKNWWTRVSSFDRKWTFASLGLLGASVLGCLVYAAQKPALIPYLQKVGFGDPDPTHPNSAPAIAAFSLGQVEWFLVLFAIAVALLLLVISGYFNGTRAKIGAVLLGAFLIFDLGRANLPWVVHWDYKQKYEVGSLNPVVELLRQSPFEHRVAYCLPRPLVTPEPFQLFQQLYDIEWTQHHFPYYDIQSLDVVQDPRPAENLSRYHHTFEFRARPGANGGLEIDPTSIPLLARKWQLTNTRYLLGPAPFLDTLNEQFDPAQHRFRILKRFDVLPKEGTNNPYGLTPKQYARYLMPDKLTAYLTDAGDYALFEFAGALPRAKIYSNWRVNTNDAVTLQTLADLNFDPAKTVLVSTSRAGLPALATNENSGSVEYQSYATKHIVLSAQTTTPSVLLLNDRFDPHWRVSVDGRPAELLRCNFIMRGVYLPASGRHTVDFSFSLPYQPLYLTAAAALVGLGLAGFLWNASRHSLGRTG